jgi:hypothetical protein
MPQLTPQHQPKEGLIESETLALSGIALIKFRAAAAASYTTDRPMCRSSRRRSTATRIEEVTESHVLIQNLSPRYTPVGGFTKIAERYCLAIG